MNLVPVYKELKYTGKGIRVAIIDDGIEYTHDDLKDNYVSMFNVIIYEYKILFLISIYCFYLFGNCAIERLLFLTRCLNV